jgi:hypothetical protein
MNTNTNTPASYVLVPVDLPREMTDAGYALGGHGMDAEQWRGRLLAAWPGLLAAAAAAPQDDRAKGLAFDLWQASIDCDYEAFQKRVSAALPAQAVDPAEEPVAVVDHVGSLELSGNAVVVVQHADAAKLTKGTKLYTRPAPAQDVAPTDAEIIAFNAMDAWFSTSESKYGRDVNPHLQYHTGEPGYIEFTRAVLARWGAAPQAGVQPFQQRVQPWMLACFGAEIAADREERNHRFLEEALELVQACGCSASEAHQLVDYVFGREVGEPAQEVGGVMVTLAALCLANCLDMHAAGETELARIWTKVDAIRAKQAAKPKHSPLPQAAQPAAQPADAQDDEATATVTSIAYLDGTMSLRFKDEVPQHWESGTRVRLVDIDAARTQGGAA